MKKIFCFSCLLMFVLFLFSIYGCSGTTATFLPLGPGTIPAGKGTLVVNITGIQARSYTIEIRGIGISGVMTTNISGVQTATITNVPAGNKTVTVKGLDVNGNTVTQNTGVIIIVANASVTLPIELGVSITSSGFSPQNVVIIVGESVTWYNNGTSTVSVVADDSSFNSGDIAAGGNYTHTFNNVGVYAYHNGHNAGQTGIVTVIEANNAFNRVYITNTGDANMTVYDTGTMTQIANSPFATGIGPKGIALDKVNNRLYIINSTAGSMTVYNTATMTQILGSPFTLTGAILPTAVVVDPVRNRLYVAGSSSNTILVYNTTTMTQITGSPFFLPPLQTNPIGMAFDESSNRLYIINQGTNNIGVYDCSTMTQITGSPFIVTGATNPVGIALDYPRRRLFVAFINSQNFAVFDTDNMTQITGSPFFHGNNPGGITIDTVNARAYISNSLSTNISSYNIAGTPTKIGDYNTGTNPTTMAVDMVSGLLYIVNTGSNNLTVYNTATMTQIVGSPFALGTSPFGIQGRRLRIGDTPGICVSK